MRQILIFLAVIAGLSGMASLARAESECNELRGDEQILPGEFLGNAWGRHELPSKGDVDEALTRLDSYDEGPLANSVDLNRDGKPELFLASPDGKLCGNAGCPYVLLDPESLKRIGEFFGHQLALLDERVNGYRIVQSYSRLRFDATNLDTYVYDVGQYRLVAHVVLDSCGLEQWSRRIRRGDARNHDKPASSSADMISTRRSAV